ncbi:MAG: hypothetical protein O7I93_17025 [Gemmatimonadetes bacterium]|nr:hypothetical protein [Gemmatimonadota bacterium]
MGSGDLMPLLGLSMLTLAGGLLSSFGANSVIRSPMGRGFVGRWRWWGLLLHYLVVAGVLVGGVGWVLRAMLEAQRLETLFESPWFFLTFGVVMGLPFTLPAVTTVWRDKRESDTRSKRQAKPASRQERLDFAQDLERQIREYVGESRPIRVRVQGEDGTVLTLEGDIDRRQGERLVAALRDDIASVNFRRVEGKGEKGEWWVRV